MAAEPMAAEPMAAEEPATIRPNREINFIKSILARIVIEDETLMAARASIP